MKTNQVNTCCVLDCLSCLTEKLWASPEDLGNSIELLTKRGMQLNFSFAKPLWKKCWRWLEELNTEFWDMLLQIKNEITKQQGRISKDTQKPEAMELGEKLVWKNKKEGITKKEIQYIT